MNDKKPSYLSKVLKEGVLDEVGWSCDLIGKSYENLRARPFM